MSHESQAAPPHELRQAFRSALLQRNRPMAMDILQQLQTRMSTLSILDQFITPVLEEIGTDWESGTVALSQVYMGGRLCEEVVDTLFPFDAQRQRGAPRIAIAVLQDHHVLGKRIVASALRTLGYHLHDYGHGVDVTTLVRRVREEQIQVLLISALMFPSALAVRTVRDSLADIVPRVQIAVGGAPFRFDDQLWRQVGADAMGTSATDAISIVERMCYAGEGIA